MAAGILARGGRNVVAWCVVLSAGLAGCIGGGGPDPSTSASGDASGGAAGGAPASGSLPSSDGANGTDAGSAAEPALAELAPKEIAFSWDGSIGAHLCIPSGIHSCQSIEITAGSPRTEFVLEALPVAFDLELRWSGLPAVNDRLSAALTFLGVDPARGLATAGGTSPLVLAGENLTLAGEPSFALTVQPPNTGVIVEARIYQEQPFRIEGTFTVMLPAT